MRSCAFALSLVSVLSSTCALAQDALPGARIAEVIAGHTVQGSMTSSGPYAEFYDADGTIRGDGYTGAWTVEGDAMCFQYGEAPATCYGVGLEGDTVTWLLDGAVEGSGTLVEGNPNGF